MKVATSAAIDKLVVALHACQPLRVWSLIVTFYGDAVVPRGGEIWLGTISELMQAMEIDDRAVRAAMSRLARDGWVERYKIGRRSFYGLSAAGHDEFAAASERIYTRPETQEGGEWQIVLLGEGNGRQSQRERLLKAGFGQLSANMLIGTIATAIPGPAAGGATLVFRSTLERGSEEDLIGRAFDLAPLAVRYHAFMERYKPLWTALDDGDLLAGIDAMIARTLLIHDYRRIVLRDPFLPKRYLPEDWAGHEARKLCAGIYKVLQKPSDAWLCSAGQSRDGDLPKPVSGYFQRFAEV
ncbi:phenylacetic acid degradation operon negative regulatory protein PaaX [Rhizobiales bacterium]|uniref:PaaX family transcriptional regulator C-terminal domain-containing protein n=1 Tax=Hongsoonwoonella zoysiae TaxID=2821844 RepID=UPI0015611E4D|nr:PaaX family transcriptional regulator C-terminal domain-containing protein [Hongsoonwoonella zoysiae]NRG19032.1 phenylacetic acid degradation operon negative regulatory protein PaaX [Hongsoonwoonella zoysiae]